jgi:hypothetical protein
MQKFCGRTRTPAGAIPKRNNLKRLQFVAYEQRHAGLLAGAPVMEWEGPVPATTPCRGTESFARDAPVSRSANSGNSTYQ